MIHYLTKKTISPDHVSFIKYELIAWYTTHGRHLPWRTRSMRHASPYQVWISEIMLQQTTVATVIPYFTNFITKWPTLEDLVQGSLDEVLHMWQGLGYYSRARNLYAGALYVHQNFAGQFPEHYATLLKIPGIGPYTAAAIASIAFYQPIIPIDGNIIRVFSRLMGLEESIDTLKKTLMTMLIPFFDAKISGDFTQALMDLGALVCTSRSPKCAMCPLKSTCYAYQTNQVHLYPKAKLRRELPVRQGNATIIINDKKEIMLRQRPTPGLLAGLWEPPSFGWDTVQTNSLSNYDQEALIPLGKITHTFTHFKLILNVTLCQSSTMTVPGGHWVAFNDLSDYALSTLAKKIIAVYDRHM